VLLALTPRLLPESVDPDCVRCFDLAGAVTVTAGVLALVLAIAEAPDAGWGSPQTIGLLAGPVALLATFVRIEGRSLGPLVPLRIFRSRSLIGGNLVLLTAGMCVDGRLIIATLYAQNVLGYSTIQFGLMTAVMTVMSRRRVHSAEPRRESRPAAGGLAGMTLIGSACVLFTQVSVNGNYLDDLFVGFLLFGPGLGAAFVASQIAALAGVAVARTEGVLEGGGAELSAITEGFQSAFLVAIGFAVVGAMVASVFLRSGEIAGAGPAAPLATTRDSET
jgi:hypothetical protein